MGAEDVAENLVRQICASHSGLGQSGRHLIAVACDCRLYPKLVTLRKNQQASFGAGVFDGPAHDRVEQLLQNDLARYRF